MLAAEHALIDISLISCSPNFHLRVSFGINLQLSIFTQRQSQAEVTQPDSYRGSAQQKALDVVRKLSKQAFCGSFKRVT
jgi:hypothetical protein